MDTLLSFQYYSHQGLRSDNEDYEGYVVNLTRNGNIIDKNKAAADVFIICDGHGGGAVSEYAGKLLRKNLSQTNLNYPLSESFIRKKYNAIQQKIIDHPNHIGDMCGSTALVLVRFFDANMKQYIQVFNTGDCRAILSRRGVATVLTKDHKPIWPDEQLRISKVNKSLPKKNQKQIHYQDFDWRVGDLSVSRSFGDLYNTPHVTHLPDIFMYKIEKDDEFIVMGCDGLFDNLENHDIINFVKDHISENIIDQYIINSHQVINQDNKRLYVKYPMKSGDSPNLAFKLAEYAIAKGSSDNISVIIIFL